MWIYRFFSFLNSSRTTWMADISLSSPRRSSIAVVFAAGAAAPSGNDAALGTATGACVWNVVKLSKQSSHRFGFPCVDILLCLVDLLLLQLKDNLEEIPHGDDNLPRGLLRLDPKEAMAVLRTAVDVTEGAVVRHVLRDEADLVHRVMVEAILIWTNIKIDWKIILLAILTPVFSSLILRPSTAIWILTWAGK